jgi:hypothetical protein
MDLYKLAGVGIDTLLTEITRRIRWLERDAARLGSVGRARSLVDQAFAVGRGAGRADILRQLEDRIAGVLEAATAKTPPPATDSSATEPSLEYHREARRALWGELETLRGQLRAEADAESAKAAKQRAWIEQYVAEALAPSPSLRVRLGQWLITSVNSHLVQRGGQ